MHLVFGVVSIRNQCASSEPTDKAWGVHVITSRNIGHLQGDVCGRKPVICVRSVYSLF